MTPKAAGVKSGSNGWSGSFPPFGTDTNSYVWGNPACTTYLEQIVVMWQSREDGSPLYFGIYAGDPNNGGDGLILGPTHVLDASSGAAVTTTFTPTLITLDNTLHLVVGSNSQTLLHYCFNHDISNPLWVLADTGKVGPTSVAPALGLLDDSTIMCMWVNSSNNLDWAYWQQDPNWNPDPSNPNQAPPGQWNPGKSSVAANGQVISTPHTPALLMLNGKLAMSYVDWNNSVQLLAFGDLNSQYWSTVAPGLNPDPSAQGVVAPGYDDKYAIIAARSPGQQGIAVSIWRGGTWDGHSGLNQSSQENMCAVILNRCAYIFFQSTDGGPQYQLLCCYLDLTTIPYHPSSWMKDTVTDRRLNVMAIPGTHDTGTYNANWLYKQFGIGTQGMDLRTQLYAGIRAFDFRLKLDSGGHVVFVHGGWDVDLDFSDARAILYKFQGHQPNEALIVCMMNDSDGACSDENLFQGVDDELHDNGEYHYWYGGKVSPDSRVNDLPLLSQARGLIVLLRRFPFPLRPTFGVDFSSYSGKEDPSYVGGKFTVSNALQNGDLYVQAQDIYQIGLGHGSGLGPIGTPVPDYDLKFGYVANVLNVSAEDTSSTSSNLFVNFTSAACVYMGKGIPPPFGWGPSDLAEGMSVGNFITGYTDYEGINSMVRSASFFCPVLQEALTFAPDSAIF